jgi:hypothetical protein
VAVMIVRGAIRVGLVEKRARRAIDAGSDLEAMLRWIAGRNASDEAFRCPPFLKRKLHDEMFWRLTEAKRNYNAGALIGQGVNTAV